MNRRLFAGFDSGGSKTVCALCDESGRVLGTGTGGPSNYRYCGEEVARVSMRDALLGAFASSGLDTQKLDTAYVSSATIPTYGGASYEEFFLSCVPCERIHCEGDIYPIWYASCQTEPAIVCIVGTGSVAYLFRGEETVRAGGWGPQISDEGSGYWIAVSAMNSVMRMYDGRSEKNREFMSAVLSHFDVDSERRLVGAAKRDRAEVATLARTVCSLCANGNPEAIRIIKAAAEEIAGLIRAVLGRDDKSDMLSLVLSGGLAGEGGVLTRELKRLISNHPRIKSVETTKAAPELICAALALEKAHLNESAQRLLSLARGEVR